MDAVPPGTSPLTTAQQNIQSRRLEALRQIKMPMELHNQRMDDLLTTLRPDQQMLRDRFDQYRAMFDKSLNNHHLTPDEIREQAGRWSGVYMRVGSP